MTETIEQKCIAKGVKLTEQRKIIAKLLILTNGTDTYCIEIDLKKNKASYLKEIPSN